jgi:hypothetical protein
VAVDDVSNLNLWTRLFLDEQGYRVSRNVVHQDNKSAILLETNSKRSSSKRMRAIISVISLLRIKWKRGTLRSIIAPQT